jgi:tRNA pseudouridine32 synthase / 23S rRNA pseudouridine746 synthase
VSLVPLPVDGVLASAVVLPDGPWPTVLDFLCHRFPAVSRQAWLDRIARGRVLDDSGAALVADRRHRPGVRIHYYRDPGDEPAVAGVETVLHVDEHLVVVDKPPFLPVMPGGAWARDTLQARLIRRLGNPHLVPLHRLDRHTAGLVLVSASPTSRDAYQALFRQRRITRSYQCLAGPPPDRAFPLTRASRLVAGEPFFRVREVAGAPNSETHIELAGRDSEGWRYALTPTTGKKHQLRVHMATLGAPILGDPYYPELLPAGPDDPDRPLRLVAHRLAFVDPLSGAARRFDSARTL